MARVLLNRNKLRCMGLKGREGSGKRGIHRVMVSRQQNAPEAVEAKNLFRLAFCIPHSSRASSLPLGVHVLHSNLETLKIYYRFGRLGLA